MIELILTLVLVGVLLYYLEKVEQISPPIRMLIRVVVVLACVLYLIRVFGLDLPVPRLRS